MNKMNEREAFEKWFEINNPFEAQMNDGGSAWFKERMFLCWQASENREGWKLVPVDSVSIFYQDDSEPENFCTLESDLDNLGDLLDTGEIMIVNKYTQAELSKEKLYGAWCEIETPYGTSRKFKIFNTEKEAKQEMIGGEG